MAPSQPPRTTPASRERNRIHARKTRLRKKEQMQSLQQRADELKAEQMQLKQTINEKSTASILVDLFAKKKENERGSPAMQEEEDPRVEALLRRNAEEIPDSSKIPELPALILPGQHASKKAKAESDALSSKESELPYEGFDYALLGKDRSKCTPEELDQIRRERNRMHAKRTRDRKRLFMEEMAEICRQLEEENDVLRAHLKTIDPDSKEENPAADDSSAAAAALALLTPKLSPNRSVSTNSTALPKGANVSSSPSVAPTSFKFLLEAACAFEPTRTSETIPSTTALLSVASAISKAAEAEVSVDEPRAKRRRVGPSPVVGVPTAVGC